MYILIEFALLISTLKSKSKNWLYRSSGKHHKDIIICIYIYVFTNPTSHELFAAEGIAASPDQLKHWKLGSWLLSIFKDSPQICLDYSNLSYWKQACGSNQIWSNFYQHRIIFLVGRKFGASFLPKASGCGSSLFSELPLVRHGALFLPVGEIEGCRGCHEEMKT